MEWRARSPRLLRGPRCGQLPIGRPTTQMSVLSLGGKAPSGRKTDQKFPKYPTPTRMLEGKPLKGCTPKAAHRYATRGFQETSDNKEGQQAKFQDQGRSKGLPALFRSPAGLRQRDYYTSANHDGLQGVKDPRGPVGMTASPTARIPV
jgi:hypothetical protein